MKSKLIILFVGIFVFGIVGVVSAACPSGMVSYWTFDNADLSGSDPLDVFGSNDGTNNGAITGISGQVGDAFSLDGVDDYIGVADDNSLDLRLGNGSIGLWFKVNSIDNQYSELISHGDRTGDEPFWKIYIDSFDDELRFSVIESRGGPSIFSGTQGNTPVNDGGWHHLIAVWDSSNDYPKIYLDGQSDSSGYNSGGDVGDMNIAQDLRIGGGSRNGDPFNGIIDEVVIFDRLLTQPEIEELYDKGIAKMGYCEGPPFISTWDTTLTSSGSSGANQVKLPLESGGTYNFLVDWGDSTSDTITQWDHADVTHTYGSEGVKTIEISGTIEGFRFANTGDKLKILDISQWGDLNVGNNGGYFYGASNLDASATDALDLTGTTSFYNMFRDANNFNGDISNWDVSSVTTMWSMFWYANNFNQDLNSWDVSSAVDMQYMFAHAPSFNQPLNSWDVSNVIDMYGMFFSAYSFNQSLNSWNTSRVEDMHSMFRATTSFNQPLNNNWDTSSVTDMGSMFDGAVSFNQDINNWDTSYVNDMSYMFYSANAFNQPLNSWDTSSVKYMDSMFAYTDVFNQPLNSWDTSSVTDMGAMFRSADVFDQPLNSWNTSNVQYMDRMFNGADVFDQPLNSWNTSSVTNMRSMFSYADSFNQPLNLWDTSKVTDMEEMFFNADTFNQPLNNWDVSSVTTMIEMFNAASEFNQNLSNWDVSNVMRFQLMFASGKFNGSISAWNVSGAKYMSYMFYNAYRFNQNISNWDVSSVTNMGWMFTHASRFNQPLNNWDVSSVTDMRRMFWDAKDFNQPLNNWDTSKVDDMGYMFYMFEGTGNFDQDLGSWNVSSLLDANRMFLNVKLSVPNYDSLLIGWSALLLQNGVIFDGGNSQYSAGAAAAAKQYINDTFGWTITDGGEYVPTISDCGDVGTGTWVLDRDITGVVGTCFNIVADDVVLDLNGYTIEGTGTGIGVRAYGYDPANRYDFGYGNVVIKNGTVRGFASGVSVTSVENPSVIDITSEGNMGGISVNLVKNLTFKSNNMSGNSGRNFGFGSFYHPNGIENIGGHIIEDNIIDYSYKIYYNESVSGLVYDSVTVPDAGMIICVECEDTEIRGLDLSHYTTNGILIYNGTNTLVEDLNVSYTDNEAILFLYSSGIYLEDLNIIDNYETGIFVGSSSDIIVNDIYATGNDWVGLYSQLSSNITITNLVSSNNGGPGLALEYNIQNVILENITTNDNDDHGIVLETYNFTMNNIISKRNEWHGIEINWGASDGSFSNMELEGNEGDGIYIDGGIWGQHNSFENITSSNHPWGTGMMMDYSENVSMKNVVFNNNSWAGALIEETLVGNFTNISINGTRDGPGLYFGGNNINMRDITSNNNSEEGIFMYDASYEPDMEYFNFLNVVTNNNGGDGIWADFGYSTSVNAGKNFTNITSNNNGGRGVYFNNMKNITMVNNRFCYNALQDVGCSFTQKLFSNNYCDAEGASCGGVCFACEFSVPGVSWRDMNGNEITEANRLDTVKMTLTGSGSAGDFFEIKEDDPAGDDNIHVVPDEIVGDFDGGRYVGIWEITEGDFAKGVGIGELADGHIEAYFEINGDTSEHLNVNVSYEDDPMDVTIVSPDCGDYFNESETVSVVVTASDADDVIDGTVSINGVVEEIFANEGVSFDYVFVDPGNYQIVAEATNTRGKRSRHITNIMILDTSYIDGDKYIAACILEPKDFSDIEGSEVNFSAVTTRAIEIVSGAPVAMNPGDSDAVSRRFSWFWRFVAPNQQIDDIVYEFANTTDTTAYRFSVVFPVAGDNSASLRVEFD